MPVLALRIVAMERVAARFGALGPGIALAEPGAAAVLERLVRRPQP